MQTKPQNRFLFGVVLKIKGTIEKIDSIRRPCNELQDAAPDLRRPANVEFGFLISNGAQ